MFNLGRAYTGAGKLKQHVCKHTELMQIALIGWCLSDRSRTAAICSRKTRESMSVDVRLSRPQGSSTYSTRAQKKPTSP